MKSTNDDGEINHHRRAVTIGALAVPTALATHNSWSAATGATDPIRDMIVVNGLGALFDEGAISAEQAQRRLTVTVENYPELVTERSLAYAREAGMTAVNITLGYVDGPVEPFEHTMREFGRWNRIMRHHRDRLIKVHTTDDIVRAKRENKTGVIYGFQNGVAVGEDPARVQIFADLGLNVFQLTYNKPTQLGDGSIGPHNRGLTALGRDVVAELNRCRVMTDLSHSGQQICLDAARASKLPITISHTGCRALADLPRNKSDEELRLVAERGGYVGIYFMAFLRTRGPARSEDLIAHIEHAIKVCGEDHVGIGTDGLVSPVDVEAFMKQQRAWVAERVKAGIAAPGEENDAPFLVVDLTGPEQFRKLAQLLHDRGHPWSRVEKILGRNYLRVARDVWGA